MASQQATPANSGTHVVSALPLAWITRHKAVAAPKQTGSSRIAIISFAHFGTAGEFRIQNSEASKKACVVSSLWLDKIGAQRRHYSDRA